MAEFTIRQKLNNNTSGYQGVVFHKNAWVARIYVNYQDIYLGRFQDKKKAARAYNKAARKYFGKYTYLNQI